MIPLQSFATGVLADLVRRQPPSPARTTFAWELAVGQAVARSTTVEMREDGVLVVRPRDAHWAREIQRAAPTILERLTVFLGKAAVTKLEIAAEVSPRTFTQRHRASE